MPPTQSAQMSASDRKKKDKNLLKKMRAKKRAFRAKKALFLNTASAVANFQGKQVQVKQGSQTSDEIYSEVHKNTAIKQLEESEKDRLTAALEILQAHKEGAVAAAAAMGAFTERAAEHRRATSQELINSAGNVNKLLNGLFQGLSDARKKDAEDAARAIIELSEQKKSLLSELAAARANGDAKRVEELTGKLGELDKGVKAAIGSAGADLDKGLKDLDEALAKEREGLEAMDAAIKQLMADLDKGAEAFNKGIKDIAAAAAKHLPWLAAEPHYPVYWCYNMINSCRGAYPSRFSEPHIPRGEYQLDSSRCLIEEVEILGTGGREKRTRPHFCHENKVSAAGVINEFKGNGAGFSELHQLPLIVINKILTNYVNNMSMGSFTEDEVRTITDDVCKTFFLERLCPTGKPHALKVYFPGAKETDSPQTYNKMLANAIATEYTWVMKNGKNASP